MSRWLLASALLLATAVGCNAKHAAMDAGKCWPLDASPGGQVELGTGDVSFEPLPAILPVMANGSQSDPYIELFARIRGIPPGNPNDFFDPTNPRTKMSATVPALGLALGVSCPSTIGYVPSPVSGAYDLLHSLRIGTGAFPVGELDGKQADLVVEVVGSNGLYARDEKTVALSVSFSSTPDAGVGTDAGGGSDAAVPADAVSHD